MSTPVRRPLNRLARYLERAGPPCERLACGTCGGLLGWIERFRVEYPDRAEVLDLLETFTGSDLLPVMDRMPTVFSSLQGAEAASIWTKWVGRARREPTLLAPLLTMILEGLRGKVSDEDLREVLEGVGSDAVREPQLRAVLRRLAEAKIGSSATPDAVLELGWPSRVCDAILEDLERERAEEMARARVRRRVEEAAAVRRKHLESFARLPFLDRVDALLADPSIEWRKGEWCSSWGVVDEAGLADLDHAGVNELLRSLDGTGASGWSPVIEVLLRRRQALRLQEMAALRAKLAGLDQRAALLKLLDDRTVPIEHWPAELLPAVDLDWRASLDEARRSQLDTLIQGTKMRAWKRVGAKLGLGGEG